MLKKEADQMYFIKFVYEDEKANPLFEKAKEDVVNLENDNYSHSTLFKIE